MNKDDTIEALALEIQAINDLLCRANDSSQTLEGMLEALYEAHIRILDCLKKMPQSEQEAQNQP